MIGYKLHRNCFGDVLLVAVFYAEVTGEKEDRATARASALAELDGCPGKSPTPPRSVDRFGLRRYRCHRH